MQAGSESLILLTPTPFNYNRENHKITSNYQYRPIYTVLYFLMFSLGYCGVSIYKRLLCVSYEYANLETWFMKLAGCFQSIAVSLEFWLCFVVV